MRVLVTGASGFLGSNLVCAAVARGWTVRAMLRRQSANPSPRDPPVIKMRFMGKVIGTGLLVIGKQQSTIAIRQSSIKPGSLDWRVTIDDL